MKIKPVGCSQLTNIPKVECNEIPTVYELAKTINPNESKFHFSLVDMIEKRKEPIGLFKFNKSKHFK